MSRSNPVKRVAVEFKKGARQFAINCASNIALMLGLAVAPAVAVIGVTMDISQVKLTQTRLQKAADAAAIALGECPNLSRAEGDALAQREIAVRLGADGKRLTLSIIRSESSAGRRIVEFDAAIPTLVMRIANIAWVNVSECTPKQWMARAPRQPFQD